MTDKLEMITLRMSERLRTVSDMLGNTGDHLKVADVGCDHGYVSIYLLLKEIADTALLMDVRKGPLSGADKNLKEFDLMDRASTRLSDGLAGLSQNEADSLIIAGMGGKLMIRLLDSNKPKDLGIKRAVLQPQSDIPFFRQYLRDNGFNIVDERVILEDGKYYFPIKVEICDSNKENDAFKEIISLLQDKYKCDYEAALSICNRFGEWNLYHRDPLLMDYLTHGSEVCDTILGSLDSKTHTDRYNEVLNEKNDITTALLYLKS